MLIYFCIEYGEGYMYLSNEIMNFINEHYLKLVIGLVLVLMAIIGYYAEKTNFGNKLKKENKKENKVDIDNIGLNDFVESNSDITSINQTNEIVQDSGNLPSQENINENNINGYNENFQSKETLTEEQTLMKNNVVLDDVNVETNLDDEFKKVFPTEESMDYDLMVDINNMHIEPLESVDISNNNAYAKLSSNIDLPEINDFESSGDVWKF